VRNLERDDALTGLPEQPRCSICQSEPCRCDRDYDEWRDDMNERRDELEADDSRERAADCNAELRRSPC
jgi:hypothetical protein